MRILGIEDRYRDDLRRWSDSSNASLGGKLSAERWLEVERDILEFQQVICGILDDRRANPRDDLTSYLLDEVEIEGNKLDDDVAGGMVILLLIAGIDMTWSAIGS